MSPAAANKHPAVGLDAIYRTVEVLGDAWSWLIMREALLYDVRHFSQFQTRLGLARSTLAARLGHLSSGGLLVEHPRARGSEYHPSESGRDFLACLLVAMRWGERWCFVDGPSPVSAVHLGCGHKLEALLRCTGCQEVVTAHSVAARRPGPFTESAGMRARRRTPDLSLLERKRTCPIARTLSVIGDHWTNLLIREAFFGVRRFDVFQQNLGIAPNILSGRLRRLVEHDILYKAAYDDWPVRHEYRLTDRGLDLYHVPLAMLTWGQRWLPTDASDVLLTHTTCGNDLRPVSTCARCGNSLTADEIHVN